MKSIHDIPDALCCDLVDDTDTVLNRPCVITTLQYPNGDSINLFFDETVTGFVATDEGATRDNLADRGISLSNKERRALVQSICEPLGVNFSAGRLSRAVSSDAPGRDVLALCQAIVHVSSLHHMTGYTERSVFPILVESVVRTRVQGKCEVTRLWTAPDIDPGKAFPVDYHLNGAGRSKNIFWVNSTSKALLVTAVSQFLLSHQQVFPTLSIIDLAAKVRGRHLDRLQHSSTEFIFGVEGNEDQIEAFALGGGSSRITSLVPAPWTR